MGVPCTAFAARFLAGSGMMKSLPVPSRLTVGLLAPQFWHLPVVGWRLKKAEIVSIIASRVWAVTTPGLRGPSPAPALAALSATPFSTL